MYILCVCHTLSLCAMKNSDEWASSLRVDSPLRVMGFDTCTTIDINSFSTSIPIGQYINTIGKGTEYVITGTNTAHLCISILTPATEQNTHT